MLTFNLTFPRNTGKKNEHLQHPKIFCNMPSRKKIPDKTKATIRALKATTELSLEEIAQRCKVSKTSVHRIISAQHRAPENRRHLCGRKMKLTPEQEALILQSIEELRDQEGSFSSRRLMERTGIRHVTDRTVRRRLNRNGYFFLQARKKGLMSQTDKDNRVAFARRMQADYPPNVWTDSIAFYLDGVSFVYKAKPLDQARAPKGRVWRRKSEGLKQGCLAKGRKAGTGGKVAKFMVAITYGRGVLVCERYEKMDGNYFASFIDRNFNSMFARSGKGSSRLWLQDGDPSQNSKAAREAMARCQSELLKLCARSPCLNPIENVFNVVSRKLEKDALEQGITRESYEEFCNRVQRTINGISRELIDKTIESMNGRIAAIIRSNGERLKY